MMNDELKAVVFNSSFRIHHSSFSLKRIIKMLKRRLILCLIALASFALAGADATRAQTRPELTEEFHQTYPLAADGSVSLSNINGDVRVVAWDRGEVKVDAVKRAYMQERLREAQINVDAGARHIEIETKYPEYRWTRRQEQWENPASIEYTITVPRGARIDQISLVNGSLNIEGLSGAVNASSVNGRMVARGLTGAVNLSVVNGKLDATLDRLNDSGTVSLNSVNGPLVVTIPSDSNATVRADTVHGQISNDFNLPVREGEYVGRDLEGRLGQGGSRVRLNNVNGSITIRRANDNRPLSPATNLLSETRSRVDYDDDRDDDNEQDAREAAREAREAAREARAEAKEAAREASRERREAIVEAERERDEAQREAEREIQESQREIARETARAAKEAAKAVKDATKDLLKDDARGKVIIRDDSRRQIERVSNTLPVSGAARVRVETFEGAIYVHAWDKPEVMYTAIKRASGEREMKGIKLEASGGGGSEVSIRAEFDKSFSHEYEKRDGHIISFSSDASTELDVYVPRNSTLFVSTGDGRLRVDGVSGELELHTGDGSIDVTGARGRVRAETGDGSVRLENFEGDAEARTGDGRITLDGNFRSLAARTGDGTISLSVPEGANATIETNAESVFNDGVAVAETPNESRVRRWRIGGGGQVFTLRTGDGNIVIRRR
jgi:DUF4097 and DUF4098 domain-containing protein YvlB